MASIREHYCHTMYTVIRFEIFFPVEIIHIVTTWVVTPCSLVSEPIFQRELLFLYSVLKYVL
jgi:hypothetical protein